MLLQIVLLAGSLIASLLMGAAVLGAVGGNRKWRAFARPDESGARALDATDAAFQPLQMEPFPMKWPSEMPRRESRIPDPPWPSENWDDEYFGVRSREDLRRVRERSVRLEAERDAAYREEANRLRLHEKGRREERGQQAQDRQARRDQERADDRDRKKERKRREAAPTPPPVEEAFFVQDTAAGPTADEIAALVREYGLAGAVEQIRTRTGWDFRQAAQYLAQTLRDQK